MSEDVSKYLLGCQFNIICIFSIGVSVPVIFDHNSYPEDNARLF